MFASISCRTKRLSLGMRRRVFNFLGIFWFSHTGVGRGRSLGFWTKLHSMTFPNIVREVFIASKNRGGKFEALQFFKKLIASVMSVECKRRDSLEPYGQSK